MIRTGVICIVAVGLLALAFAPSATAADAVPGPCTPAVEGGVRAAFPAAVDIKCPDSTASTDAVEADVRFGDGRIARVEVTAEGKVTAVTYGHGDQVVSSGKGMALLFWVFALVSVVGAVFVVTRRNLIAAVMGMVGSFLGIAAIYMMLYAQFLAVIQMLVYAGAIMVLFVFVVMILNRPEDEPVAPSGRAGQVIGGLAILYLIARLVGMLVRVEPPNLQAAMAAPPPTPQGHDWGSIGAVGTDLFGPGLFPFEAISILLLVAVVGAIAIARPLRDAADSDDADDPDRTVGGDHAKGRAV